MQSIKEKYAVRIIAKDILHGLDGEHLEALAEGERIETGR
jgi:hypothetical protein